MLPALGRGPVRGLHSAVTHQHGVVSEHTAKAILTIDLENFKSVACGYEKGDQARFPERLHECFAQTGVCPTIRDLIRLTAS